MPYPHYANEKKGDRSPSLFDSIIHVLYTAHKGIPKIHCNMYKSGGQVGISSKTEETGKKINKNNNNKKESHNNTEGFYR